MHQEVNVPACHAAFHDVALLAGMLLDQAQCQVTRLQRRWAVFSETIASRFCQTLGMRAAVASYHDFEDAGLLPGRRFHAGGFEIEMLRFRRGTALNAPSQDLQILGLNVPPTPKVDPQMAELQAQLQRQLLPLTWFLRYVIGPPMRIVGWIFITWLRLSSLLRRHRPSEIDAWWQELIQPPTEDIEPDGTVVVADSAAPFAPKGPPLTQPRATYWGTQRIRRIEKGQRPGRSPGERLARWAEGCSPGRPFPVFGHLSQGVAQGWANACPFGARREQNR